MTLGNMRENGCRSITVYCACGRYADVNVDRFPDELFVPDLRLRFRCKDCGQRAQSTRPNVLEWGRKA